MKSKVVYGYLLVEVDKVTAINLFQKGFEIAGIGGEGELYWMDRTVYDEEDGCEREMTFDEVTKEIMDYDGEVYIANNIPINFVEIKNNEQVIKTKYKVGDIVYAFMADFPNPYSPGRIKELKVVGISIKQAYNTTSNMNVDSPSRATNGEMYTNFCGNCNVVNNVMYYVVENRSCQKLKAIVIEEEYLFKNKNELKESI